MGKRALLTYGGERGPKSEVATTGAIVTLYDHLIGLGNKPDFVYLLPSSRETTPARHTHDHAESTQQCLQERGQAPDSISIIPLEASNAADAREVLPEMRRRVGEILAKHKHDDMTFEVNDSSGTPQMKDVWKFPARRWPSRRQHLRADVGGSPRPGGGATAPDGGHMERNVPPGSTERGLLPSRRSESSLETRNGPGEG